MSAVTSCSADSSAVVSCRLRPGVAASAISRTAERTDSDTAPISSCAVRAVSDSPSMAERIEPAPPRSEWSMPTKVRRPGEL
ncbi:hypothetical protein [Haloactinopolyspora alba]|uniref:hypothetical protein n=1 Tax=Haloactinopolyspora alba TaxID=648780 RepID=UPI00101DAE58|nr:hypothetical protein [Haloactinopolyspora alba]